MTNGFLRGLNLLVFAAGILTSALLSAASSYASDYQIHSISGTVTLNGTGISGVTFGDAPCTSTDSTGAYSCAVPLGWSGTITPKYNLTPTFRSYSGVSADLTDQNFTASQAWPLNINSNVAAGTGTFGWHPAPIFETSSKGTYPDGTIVTITAIMSPFSFVSWEGCDSVTGNECSVIMNCAKSVTVTIAPSPPVAASCGSANGTTVFTAPTGNLCSFGTASTVTGTGPWAWTCQGFNGGSNAACSASVQNASMSQLIWQQTWGPAGGDIRAIAIDRNNPEMMYAAAYGSGVFRTDNGGATWIEVSNGINHKEMMALAIDPGNSQIVYAANGVGVFKTINGGAWWNQIGDVANATFIAVDPTNTLTLYVASNGGGVYKSIDGGVSWFTVNDGLRDGYKGISSLVIDPTNTNVLYAGDWVGGGVYKSTDGGSTWTSINTGLPTTNPSVWALAIDPLDSQTLYAGTYGKGVYKTTNGGDSWSAVNTGLSDSMYVLSLAIDPADSQTVYMGTLYNDVFKTVNGGASWRNIANGLTALRTVRSLLVHPINTHIVFAGTDSGVLKADSSPIRISGHVMFNGMAVTGVTFSGALCSFTKTDGAYVCSVSPGWSGSITPILDNYAFNPSSRSYSHVTTNQIDQDYAVADMPTWLLTITKVGASTGITGLAVRPRTAAHFTLDGDIGAAIYPEGTPVTLAAIGGAGTAFLSWTGCDSTTGNECTVTMNSPKSVTVTYVPVPVNGSCGTANGSGVTSAPVDNLCSSGSAYLLLPPISGNGPWSWICKGSNGGTSEQCSANISGPSHTVTVTATPGGLVGTETQAVVTNATAAISVIPVPGYHPVVTGCNGSLSGNTYTTGPITADCTVAVAFAKSDVTFKEAAYLAANPDVAAAVKTGEFTSGWQHYELFGRTGGRRLAPEGYGSFNETTYLMANPDVAAVVTAGGFANGWQHYEIFGRAEGRPLEPAGYANFDEEEYLAASPDVAAAVKAGTLTSGWQHYEIFGRTQGRPLALPSYGSFREREYLLANPDVAAAVQSGVFTSGWQHYDTLGRAEGRNTTPAGYVIFCEAAYLAANKDVAAAVTAGTLTSGWQHYDIFGRNEGRPVTPPGYANYNEEAYLVANPDIATAVTAGVVSSGWDHYDHYGRNEGRPLNPASYGAFSEADYLAANPDVLQAVLDGIFASGWQHYENLGKNEDRNLRP